MSGLSPRIGRRVVLQSGLAVSVLGGVGASTAQASAAPAASRSAAPEIAGTADWGARDATQQIEIHDTPPTFIVVHHTETENSSDTSQEHAFALAKSIQDYHMDSNGWGDTGQNFTNSRGGWLMEGRHETLGALQGGTSYVEGIHAGDANEGSQGIENEGTYFSEDVPAELWNSLVDLCAHICAQYGIAAGEIYGHRDYMSTDCPGDVLYGRLPELREAVGGVLGTSVVQPSTWPLLQPGQSGPRVAAAQHLLRDTGAVLTINGSYDNATRHAVEEFASTRQTRRTHCSATRGDQPGLLGGDLWPLLTPVLTYGSRGEAVRALHLLLTAHGQTPGHADTLTARTDDALRAFQHSRAVRASGTTDRTTWQRLLR